jgi:hypothetical protein
MPLAAASSKEFQTFKKKPLSMAEFTGMIFGIYRVFKRGNVFFH